MRILLLLIFICNASLSIAQRNYKDGYIIKTNGDSVNGQIDYREWNQAPDKINFRPAGSSNDEIITIDDCSAFGLTFIDVRFEKHTVKMEATYLDRIKYHIIYPDSSSIRTLFLEKIFDGKTFDLYRTSDNREHFFIGHNGKVDELLIKYWRSPAAIRTGNEQFTINKVYKDQLKQYFNWKENKAMLSKLERTEYEEGEMKKFFEMLDGGGKVAPKKKYKKATLFVTGGMQFSSATNIDETKDNRVIFKADGISSPIFGGGLLVGDKGSLNNFYLGFSLLLSSMKYSGERYVRIISPSQEELEKYNVKSTALTFTSFFGYNIKIASNFSIRPELGLNLNFIIKNTMQEEVYNFTNGDLKRGKNYSFKREVSIPPIAAVFLSWMKKYEIGARHIVRYKLDMLNTNSARIRSFDLVARYLFTL